MHVIYLVRCGCKYHRPTDQYIRILLTHYFLPQGGGGIFISPQAVQWVTTRLHERIGGAWLLMYHSQRGLHYNFLDNSFDINLFPVNIILLKATTDQSFCTHTRTPQIYPISVLGNACRMPFAALLMLNKISNLLCTRHFQWCNKYVSNI